MTRSYDLGNKMRSGALWVYLQGGLNSVIQFITGIILARILDPSDFGVFYAATAYTSLLLFQTKFGIPESLIRSKSVTPEQWNSAFWFMQSIALLCAFIIILLSGWLQSFYDDDRFTLITWLMSITIILSPIAIICSTKLRRDMDYKTVSRITIIMGLVGVVVSISCALLGFGPYSMVTAGIISAIVTAILFLRKISWRPSWPVVTSGLGSILSYSWRLHLNGSLNQTSTKVDNMLIGSISGVNSLGIYNRALNTALMPVTEITVRLYQLFFSGLSRIQDDLDHTIRMYTKILCSMTTAVFPFLLVFIFSSDAFINILYGKKWLPASLPLQILAVGSMLRVISITMGSLADAQNLVSKETPIQVVNLLSTIAAVIVGSAWGLTGIAIGISLKSALVMILMQFMLSRSHLKLKWRTIIEGLSPAIIASLVATVCALATTHTLESITQKTSFLYLCIVSCVIFASFSATLIILLRMYPNNEALKANIDMFKTSALKIQKKIFN